MNNELGWEIAVEAQEAFDERDSLETQLSSNDFGRVLVENLGIFFAHTVSNRQLRSIE